MRKNLTITGGVLTAPLAVLSLTMLVPDSASAQSLTEICHKLGNGSYNLIEVSPNSVPAHERHGDGVPGGPVPGDSSLVFGADCVPKDAPPLVAPGYSGLTEEGSVRFRQQQGGGEVYLGVSDLGTGGNRVEANETWDDGTYPFSFSYDGSEISIAVKGVSLSYDITPFCGPWDTMDILVVDRAGTTGVALEDVSLESFPLGDFGPFDVPGTFDPSFKHWTVTGFDFSQPWTLTGDLRIEGFIGSAELNKVQITVGCS